MESRRFFPFGQRDRSRIVDTEEARLPKPDIPVGIKGDVCRGVRGGTKRSLRSFEPEICDCVRRRSDMEIVAVHDRPNPIQVDGVLNVRGHMGQKV